MNVVNCRKCGKLFNYIAGVQICPMCKEAAENKFQEVKKYIQLNRGCSMSDVIEACGVDSSQIQAWIRAERLEFTDDSPIKVSCESCGAMIGTGKYCEKCKNEMARNLNNMMKKPTEELKKEANTRSSSNKMRFLDRG